MKSIIFLVALISFFCIYAHAVDSRQGIVLSNEDYPAEGLASWYHAKKTATGKRFSATPFSCAMRRWDYGKYYRVCNIDNGKCVIVLHNNFGPSKKFYKRGRIIDLSKAAFASLAELKKGLIRVTVTQIDKNLKY
ncbi:MAG: septal ring lytic transglycosylase RlpA family protein [Candidatus Omnitrophica bacterium]|nr:septal ring lytic transglycosylase RlpA family protein [Candidatus Omnitrophota bacterium]